MPLSQVPHLVSACICILRQFAHLHSNVLQSGFALVVFWKRAGLQPSMQG